MWCLCVVFVCGVCVWCLCVVFVCGVCVCCVGKNKKQNGIKILIEVVLMNGSDGSVWCRQMEWLMTCRCETVGIV